MSGADREGRRPARYAPHLALPDTGFVPGRAGSVRPAEGEPAVRAMTLPPEAWRENEAWLHGVDLWNQGFLWEAHECWELSWRAPFDAEQAGFLRGMIQCAAFGLKIAIGKGESSRRLLHAGTGRIERVSTARYMGLDARAFATRFRTFAEARPSSLTGLPRLLLDD